MESSGEVEKFEFRRVGQHLFRRPEGGGRWHVAVDVKTATVWLTCGRRLERRLEGGGDVVGESLDPEAILDRMVRACVREPPVFAPPAAHSLRTRMRVGALAWWLSPPLAFGGPRAVTTEAAQAAQELAEKALADHLGSPERIEDEAHAGWEQNRERLSGVEQRAAYFLGGVGLGSTVLLASSTFLLGSEARPEGAASALAVAGLLLMILSLAASAAFALAATMQTFGRITPDITSRVIERAGKPDDAARIERAARFIASRRRSSYIANWKIARLKRAAVASAAGVVGLLMLLLAVLFTL